MKGRQVHLWNSADFKSSKFPVFLFSLVWLRVVITFGPFVSDRDEGQPLVPDAKAFKGKFQAINDSLYLVNMFLEDMQNSF